MGLAYSLDKVPLTGKSPRTKATSRWPVAPTENERVRFFPFPVRWRILTCYSNCVMLPCSADSGLDSANHVAGSVQEWPDAMSFYHSGSVRRGPVFRSFCLDNSAFAIGWCLTHGTRLVFFLNGKSYVVDQPLVRERLFIFFARAPARFSSSFNPTL